mmetsp:Transcript_15260/g.38085  ORF Transcript_15260/g.38085 Transcript_15260/m.38085 type:complete len:302 (-) Transcript_15260:875-1780(-)
MIDSNASSVEALSSKSCCRSSPTVVAKEDSTAAVRTACRRPSNPATALSEATLRNSGLWRRPPPPPSPRRGPALTAGEAKEPPAGRPRRAECCSGLACANKFTKRLSPWCADATGTARRDDLGRCTGRCRNGVLASKDTGRPGVAPSQDSSVSTNQGTNAHMSSYRTRTLVSLSAAPSGRISGPLQPPLSLPRPPTDTAASDDLPVAAPSTAEGCSPPSPRQNWRRVACASQSQRRQSNRPETFSQPPLPPAVTASPARGGCASGAGTNDGSPTVLMPCVAAAEGVSAARAAAVGGSAARM